MAINKTEVDLFIKHFKKSTESLIYDLEEYSQNKIGTQIVNLKEDYTLSDRIEIMILSLKNLANKSEIKIFVGDIDSTLE